MRWGFSGQCHAVDPAKGLDSILSEEACLAKVGSTYTQSQLSAMQSIGLKPVAAGYNTKGSAGETCAGTATGETGALTRVVSSDTITQLPACRHRRTIVERWSCIDPASADFLGNGTPVADSACAGQNAQWYAMMANPTHNMSGWTVSIDRGSTADVQNHLRTTVYEYPSSCG